MRRILLYTTPKRLKNARFYHMTIVYLYYSYSVMARHINYSLMKKSGVLEFLLSGMYRIFVHNCHVGILNKPIIKSAQTTNVHTGELFNPVMLKNHGTPRLTITSTKSRVPHTASPYSNAKGEE